MQALAFTAPSTLTARFAAAVAGFAGFAAGGVAAAFARFVAGSVVAAIVAINNIISRYWKPVRIFSADSWNLNPPVRYATEDELAKIAPKLEKETK